MKKLLGLAILSSLLMVNSNASTIDNEMRANWFSAIHNEEMDQMKNIAEAFPEVVNLKDDCQATALHMAVLNGHYNLASLLKTSGANADIMDNIGNTAQDMDGAFVFRRMLGG